MPPMIVSTRQPPVVTIAEGELRDRAEPERDRDEDDGHRDRRRAQRDSTMNPRNSHRMPLMRNNHHLLAYASATAALVDLERHRHAVPSRSQGRPRLHGHYSRAGLYALSARSVTDGPVQRKSRDHHRSRVGDRPGDGASASVPRSATVACLDIDEAAAQKTAGEIVEARDPSRPRNRTDAPSPGRSPTQLGDDHNLFRRTGPCGITLPGEGLV